MPRNLLGYGADPVQPRWPGGARVAVQFVLNVEEGAERTPLNGDAESESYLHELVGRPPRQGERDPSVEGLYEYGSRAGFWRILRLFRERQLPLTAFVCGRALELTPALGEALVADGHELAGHGYRWIDYRQVPEAEERAHIRRTVELIEQVAGRRPVGWYTGRVSANTRGLLRAVGGFLYDSDCYNDDLPHWMPGDPPQLLIPYTLVNNDCRYLLPNGFSTGRDFFDALRDAFDLLWAEGAEAPKLMSVGLHGRISGHPTRARGLERFLDYLAEFEGVWVCRREEIARHWRSRFPQSG